MLLSGPTHLVLMISHFNVQVPLTLPYKKQIIDLLGSLRCDGERSLGVAWSVAFGPQQQALPDLANVYANYDSQFQVKYYAGDESTTVDLVASGSS